MQEPHEDLPASRGCVAGSGPIPQLKEEEEEMTRRRGAGEGSIHKRSDGRWAGVVDLGWRDGKRRRKYVYGPTRAAVSTRLRTVQQQVDGGAPVPDERLRTGDY